MTLNNFMRKSKTFKENTKWYINTYNNLMRDRQKRGLSKSKLDFYTEKHHILPKSLGGTNDKDNLVLLTFREHIIAHLLLARIHYKNPGLRHVVYLMYNSKSNKSDGIKLSTKPLEEIRTGSAEYLSSKFKGRKPNQEWIIKAKQTKKLRYGDSVSDLARAAQAAGRVGMVFTEERKRKMSESMKGHVVTTEETRKKLSVSHSRKVKGPDGTVYDSIKSCSDATGKTQRWISYSINNCPERGYSYASDKITKKVKGPDGNIYDSIRQCAKAYSRDGKTIKNWIENYPEKGFNYLI